MVRGLRRRSWRYAVMTALALIMIGCGSSDPAPVAPTLLEANTARSTPTPSAPTQEENWEDYVNPTAGFELRIPSDWFRSPPSQMAGWSTSVLANFDLSSAPPKEAGIFEAPEHMRIEIGLHPHSINAEEDLSQWAQDHFWDLSSEDKPDSVQTGSAQGIQVSTALDGVQWLLALYRTGGDVIYVVAGPETDENEATIHRVLSTLSIIDQSRQSE